MLTPFAMLVAMCLPEPSLISVDTYDQLSEYSKYQLDAKQASLGMISQWGPIAGLISFVLGLVFVVQGVRAWRPLQKDQDAVQ